MEPIPIRYKLSCSEFMAACEACWKSRKQGTLTNVIAGVVGMVIGLATLRFVYPLSLAVTIAGVGLILVTGLRNVMWRRAYREARKYTEDVSVVFSEDVVHVESAEGTSALKWTFYSSYLDFPDYVLLFMTRHQFSVIPKSAFPDGRILSQFLELVGSKLKKA